MNGFDESVDALVGRSVGWAQTGAAKLVAIASNARVHIQAVTPRLHDLVARPPLRSIAFTLAVLALAFAALLLLKSRTPEVEDQHLHDMAPSDDRNSETENPLESLRSLLRELDEQRSK